ncbi:hypothetical protein BH10ACI3_BH10ACI3_25040 [soil metagenome]
MINGKSLEFYESETLPDQEIDKERLEEIAGVPQEASELIERLEENTSSSPSDSGGDIDADWEEVNTSGSESVFGHNPTPDQSDVEANAHAMGINFEDGEPLDFTKKMEKRDEDRYELDEDSKTSGGTI